MLKKELIKEYGSPLYLVEEKRLVENYRLLERVLKEYYPKFIIAYAYKANYLPGICNVFHQLGAVAEVVGDFEYDLALGNGGKIILNGPFKPRLAEAIERGDVINVDSKDELDSIKKLITKKQKIGLRINPSDEDLPMNQFGFSFTSGEFEEVVKEIKNDDLLQLDGLHMHVGTNLSDVFYFEKATEHLIKAITFLDKEGVQLERVSIGGGFPSKETCPANFEWKEWNPPEVDEIIKIVCSSLKEHYEGKELPTLILEPGRFLADNAVSLLSTVVAVKEIKGVKSAFLDAGVNILQSKQKHKVIVDKETEKENVDLYGPTCMSTDILESGIELPSLERGDILEFKNCGAYEESLSMQFSFYRPATVMLKNNKVKILRKKEELKHILRK